MLVVLLVAFMLMAHSMFGTAMKEFSTISDAAVSTIEFLMGNGDFFAMAEVRSSIFVVERLLRCVHLYSRCVHLFS